MKGPLSTYGVTQLGLFGSTVRGENTRGSDIDILLDFASDKETYQNFLDECQYVNSVITDDVTKSGFLADETLKRAVTRSLSIIGEATKKIPDPTKLRLRMVFRNSLSGTRIA